MQLTLYQDELESEHETFPSGKMEESHTRIQTPKHTHAYKCISTDEKQTQKYTLIVEKKCILKEEHVMFSTMHQSKKVRTKNFRIKLERGQRSTADPNPTQVHLPQVLKLTPADSQSGGKQGGWHTGCHHQTLYSSYTASSAIPRVNWLVIHPKAGRG